MLSNITTNDMTRIINQVFKLRKMNKCSKRSMETSLPVESYDNKPTDIQRTERTTDKPTDGHEDESD